MALWGAGELGVTNNVIEVRSLSSGDDDGSFCVKYSLHFTKRCIQLVADLLIYEMVSG